MAASTGTDIIDDGLILCTDAKNTKSYPGSGTSVTDLAGGKTGTLTNVTTDGESFTFDASGENIDFASHADYNFGDGGFTFEYWLYPTTMNATYRGVLDMRNGSELNAFSLFLSTNSGYRYYVWINNARRAYSNTIWSTNQWQHGACTWDGSTMKLWYNLQDVTAGGSSYSTTQVQSRILIGKHHTNANYRFDGNIGPIRVYNRGLSESELLQNFNALRNRFGV
mgnify:CR=1 FL=1